jgi:hypothetical protein
LRTAGKSDREANQQPGCHQGDHYIGETNFGPKRDRIQPLYGAGVR